MTSDRDKALEIALAQIDKQFGKGSIMRMGERTNMDIAVGRRHAAVGAVSWTFFEQKCLTRTVVRVLQCCHSSGRFEPTSSAVTPPP